jgi:hypothetical protein
MSDSGWHLVRLLRRNSLLNKDIKGFSIAWVFAAVLLLSPLFSGSIQAGEIAGSDLLLVPPYVGMPTESSVLVNLVAGERRISCRIGFRPASNEKQAWSFSDKVELKPNEIADVRLTGLESGTRYVYEVMAGAEGDGTEQKAGAGGFKTRMVRPDKFSFAVFSDAHITPAAPERVGVLGPVADTIAPRKPDFAIALGDNIQALCKTHAGPFVNPDHPRISYSYYRKALRQLPSETALFNVIGNWEGENGWHPEQARAWARDTRMKMIPGPGAQLYAEGGSPDGGYYAFTWGDVLCVTLHVTGYTPTNHALESMEGKVDDWTLGDRQLSWLTECLKNSRARWKLIFTHHTVGGEAGDDVNSRYGRGGALAAHVGEQRTVHDLMLKYGVQAFFYGHDHVFTYQEADGIPYICVGSAGAPWKFTAQETGYPWNVPDSGFVWVDVDGNKMNVSFVAPDSAMAGGRELKHYEIESKAR